MSEAAARYDVEVGLKKVGDGWDDLSAGVGKFTGMLDAAAGKLGNLAKYAVVGLGAGAFAAATYGVTKLGAEAESAAISIGTIFSVNGLAANVPAGITMAQDQIAKMRKDAQALPGEFEDLQKIFMTTAIPQFQAGASADQARKLSAQIMAAGAVMGLQSEMTARESAMLLSGRAGAHNVFGTRLGFAGAKAKELNAASPEKRLAMVSAETNKYAGAIDIFAHSYEGLSSTLIDNLKNFGRLASAPLFESVKETLGDINEWFNANQDDVNRFAAHLGIGVKEAFEWGKKEIQEWYPIVENFVEVAWQRMSAFWDDVKPSVMAFGQAFKEALQDPNGTIDKLHDLFVLYAAVKGVSLTMGLAGAAAPIAGAVGQGVAWMAGGGIATGAAAAGGGVAEGTALGAGGVALGGSAAVVGGAFLAAVAAWGVAAYEAADLYKEIDSEALMDAQAKADANGREIEAMVKNGMSLDDASARANDMALEIASAGDETQWALNDVATEAALAAAGLASVAQSSYEREGNNRAAMAADEAAGNLLDGATQAAKMWLEGVKTVDPNKKKAPTMKGGHGGTSIQKVEIVVTSNQSPSRIARVVEARLANLSRNRRASPYVPNYSSRDEGR